MSWYRPAFVSERQVGSWVDCVFCSGLMQANAASKGKHAATLTEAQAIRSAAGLDKLVPASSTDLTRGTTARYGWAATVIRAADGWPAMSAALVPGRGLTVGGHLSNFPAGHRLRRFSPNFTGGHRVYVQVEGTATAPVYWWMDPLGPNDGSYTGEPVTKAELQTFATGGSGGTSAPLVLASVTKRVACGGGYLRTKPDKTAPVVASLPYGATATILGTVQGTSWSIVACKVAKAGSYWYRVSRINGAPLPGVSAAYAPKGWFG
jgi:hypothetical protein